MAPLLVELTPKGREMIDEVCESVLEIRARQLSVLSHAEQEQLVDIMSKLLTHFEQPEVMATEAAGS